MIDLGHADSEEIISKFTAISQLEKANLRIFFAEPEKKRRCCAVRVLGEIAVILTGRCVASSLNLGR